MNASDHTTDEMPYSEDEWGALVDALYSHPVDSSTLRNALDAALMTLSVIADGGRSATRERDMGIAARQLRKVKYVLDQSLAREGAV